MSPLSGLVLGSAALVSSPAWWAALVAGTESVDHALVRFLVALIVSWAALSVVVGTAFASSATDVARPATEPVPVLDETAPRPEADA